MISWNLRIAVMNLVVGMAVVTPGRGSDDQPRGPVNSQGQPEVLDLIIKETPKPDYDSPAPAQVSGRVLLRTVAGSGPRSGEEISGVQGVSVTDGYSVVKTDAQGRYTLKPNKDSVFVYITRPAGHDVRGDWYKPLADRVDFELQAALQGEEDYIFVHVTDTHVSRNIRSHQGLTRFVQEVNALSPRPRFVVNSGDLLDLHKALISKPESGQRDFRAYVGIMNHLTMPYYNVAGDHTDSSYRIEQFPRGDHRCGKPLYWEYLGPHFFSFEYGKIHFASIDFGYHLGQRQIPIGGKLLEYPTNQVQPMHLEWIKQDLAQRTRGTFVVTTSEADLGKHCSGFERIAREHDIRLQLVGDSHVVTHKARSVPYRSGGALAGCWWNAKTRQLCPDLSPQGYLIYRVKGDKLEHFYKGLGQRIAITSHRVGAPLRGRVEIQAHLVHPRPGETLQYTVGGKSWHAMQEVGRPFYRALYSAAIDTSSLPDGLAEFAVRSTLSDEVRPRKFVVVNGDESSRFAADATLTFAVSPATSWTTPRAPAAKVDVLFNGKRVGVLAPGARQKYSFVIPAAGLRSVNTLSFRFTLPSDGFSFGSPQLTLGGKVFRDPRDDAIRQVRLAHWGDDAEDWGGFIAGAAEPPDESPFHRRQNVFCFLVAPVE